MFHHERLPDEHEQLLLNNSDTTTSRFLKEVVGIANSAWMPHSLGGKSTDSGGKE